MKLKLLFHSRARLEVMEAYSWYEEQINGLGEAFLTDLQYAFDFISDNPYLYAATKTKYRQAPLSRFPYIVIYRIDKEKNTILILSVFHFRRNPRKKPR